MKPVRPIAAHDDAPRAHRARRRRRELVEEFAAMAEEVSAGVQRWPPGATEELIKDLAAENRTLTKDLPANDA